MSQQHRWAALSLVAACALLPGSRRTDRLARLWRCPRPLLLDLADGRPARLRCLQRRAARLGELLPATRRRRCAAAALGRLVRAGRRARVDASCRVRVARLAGARRLALGLRIDVNVASVAALRALPRVGAAIARRIVARRRRCGRYRSLRALAAVRGIGPATLARIAPLIALGRAARSARSRQRSPTGASARCR